MKTIIHSIWALKTDLGEISNKTIEFDNEQSIIYDSVHNGTYRIETNKLYISFLCYRFEGYWGDECIFGYISKQNSLDKSECEFECKSYMSDSGERLNYEIPSKEDKVTFLIHEIYHQIRDYRVEFGDGSEMTKSRIKEWINQFHEEDRVIILEELKNIFSSRYLSRNNVLEVWDDILTKLAKAHNFEDIKSFLLNCHFIRTQQKGKSQYALLEILAVFIQDKYNISIEECGSLSKKYSIYVDDVLCTGLTFKNDIVKWSKEEFSSNKSNYEAISDGSTILICCYIFLHTKNFYKKIKQIRYEKLEKIANILRDSMWAIWIDNSINESSKLEILLPRQDLASEKILAYENEIKSKVDIYTSEKGYTTENEFYRNSNIPTKEVFFTTADNRSKIETIFLEKGIDILKNANVNNDRMRALGYSIPSHKNFGFGALCFTWRSIPNNTPLVFWYNGGGFLPLFDVRKGNESVLANIHYN